MTKTQVRILKSHFQDRWHVMRHNQKKQQKILLLEDAMLVRRFPTGRVLVHECLGEMFTGITDNFDFKPLGMYDKILMINNVEFQYLDTDSLYTHISQVAERYLRTDGSMFCTLNHRYLRYDRVNIPVEHTFDPWLQHSPLRLKNVKWLKGKARLSFGDIWLDLAHD